MNKLNITQIVSKNCGGYGAWMDNPLSSPTPGIGVWPGFQLGGGHRRKNRKSRKSRKSRKNNKRRQIKTRRR